MELKFIIRSLVGGTAIDLYEDRKREMILLLKPIPNFAPKCQRLEEIEMTFSAKLEAEPGAN